MKKLRGLRGRLSYANVAATLALCLALAGGTAVAAGKITAKDLAPDSVGGSELKANAAKGKNIKESTLDPVPSAGKANNLLWAVVQNPNGPANVNVIRAGQSNTGVLETGNMVEVEFSRDVTNCVWIASRGTPGQGNEPAGFVQTALGTTASRVEVRARNTNGDLVEGDFHIIVVC
ncbi:MAG TPA: hypothetical protein VFY99_06655 [Solirubrobacterales bacterium]